MTLTGDKQLAKLLSGLGDKVARKVTRQAVNAAANPVLKAARAKVVKRSGLLANSLGKKVSTSKDKQTVTARVGPRRDVTGTVDGKKYRPARIAHLVEHGHLTASGTHTPAQPFLRPAADETQGQALSIMESKFAAGVIREASK
ncbi:MAG: HK97 gp10 family phage protein [Tepidisphaeraceae bacterium]